ncbi:MAG: hypothetical protein VX185_17595, partial [Pseudomonadota bacterium]|nr:hypothetical protein [Pseudomonadota bacterium]
MAEVASLLMRSDTLTLPEIYKYFRQHAQERSFTTASTNEIVPIDDPAVVRNCLLVLRRHNILVIDFKPLYRVDDSTDEKVKEQNELSKVLHYSIDAEMALNRLRLPRVLLVAREVVGSFGLSIVEELIVEGQSSVNKLVKLVHELILSQSDHSEEIIELKALPEASLVGKIEKAIEELIQNRLIVEVTQMATGPKIIVASEKEKKRQGADAGNDSGKATKKRKKALSSNGEEEVVGVIGNE